jgi:hypothetical protein
VIIRPNLKSRIAISVSLSLASANPEELEAELAELMV